MASGAMAFKNKKATQRYQGYCFLRISALKKLKKPFYHFLKPWMLAVEALKANNNYSGSYFKANFCLKTEEMWNIELYQR